MRFYYKKVILWMRNGNVRELSFEPNKVNIITGGSETGKTAIAAIIDYCFFADRNIKIAEEYINENVEWYGVKCSINDNDITIARRRLDNKKPSSDYYFSIIGEEPEMPTVNASEKEIKKYINEQFRINDNVVVPYGGKKIMAGSKISVKYFMLFNSQGYETIDSSDVFFDKQTDVLYQEALERTFDMALGISSEKDVLVEEELNKKKHQLARYEKKEKIMKTESDNFEREKIDIIIRAKKLGLVPSEADDYDHILDYLYSLLDDTNKEYIVKDNNVLDKLLLEERQIKRQIKSIHNFTNEKKKYIELNEKKADSLKPIAYICEKYGELINHPAVETILDNLDENLKELTEKTKSMKKNDFGLDSELVKLNERLDGIRTEKEKLMVKEENIGIREQYMFLGEVKTKLDLFQKKYDEISYVDKINDLKDDITKLERIQVANKDKREAIIRTIESNCKLLKDRCKKALETYVSYDPIFNYREKRLELLNPKNAQIASVVGSSSNYMFLHLFLILSIHMVVLAQKVQYIPAYIILDQPSKPYYDNDNEKFRDREKITTAIQLLNDFIDIVNKEYKTNFQFIVFEHIPKDIWNNMDNVHLVEEFTNKNKLVRKQDELSPKDRM